MLVLESLEHAQERGVEILAEVIGHAASADAYHITQPNPRADGAIRAIRWALQNARVNTEDIDYINAHGTSTQTNDPLETLAIKTVFGHKAYSLPISSTKSMLGHPLGASGALEAIACIMSMRSGILHPTRNLDNPDPTCDLDYVPHNARQTLVKTVLTNSFGLGGQNAALVLRVFNK